MTDSLRRHTAQYVIILVLLTGIVCMFLYVNKDKESPVRQGSISQGDGAIDVAPNEFVVYCNTNIVVNDGMANILVENNENNYDPCVVKLVLEDGTLLYESDIMYPGFYINDAKVFEVPTKGVYNGSMVFDVYNGDSVKGTTTFDVRVTVK